MAILKCKMCGGDIELSSDKTFGTCDSCGSTLTFPKIDDEQRAAAFNRGNHFRRIGEFDKALAVYERIVREDDTDAEAHWCCALCRFGIEYVEDPTSYDYLPTCHRASFDSFLEDVDYLAALEHSDGITHRQYQKDASKIAEVQRGILATSQNAEPFDVFICYKESDAEGNRTRDSLLAQDIYYQLTEQGRKVFFARITLEDAAGTQYEPYIFAALNSAKVMIVIGTKPEHMSAVWVKNEWSRFLTMMKKDRHKLLLPCYRDMNPYDMPEQLSVLQSYDMAKIGFIQDLTRGVAKVLDAEKKSAPTRETMVVQQAPTNTAPLLKRAFIFLEDGDWKSADEYCEKVLDIDPENAQAYLGKLMAQQRIRKQEDLRNCAQTFDGSNNYQKAMRFGNEALKATLSGYVAHIKTRNENIRLAGIYTKAKNSMLPGTEEAYKYAAGLFEDISQYQDAAEMAKQCRELAQKCYEQAEEARMNGIYTQATQKMSKNTESAYKEAARLFDSISKYQDAADKARYCHDMAESVRKDEVLTQASSLMESKEISTKTAQIRRLEMALNQLETIPGWKDADERADQCRKKIEILKSEVALALKIAEEQGKRRKIIITASVIAACLIIALLFVLFTVIIPNSQYNDAIALMNDGKYEEAIAAFENLGEYEDSTEKIKESYYLHGAVLADSKKYEEAIAAFEKIRNYKDSSERIAQCYYQQGDDLLKAGSYGSAIISFTAAGNHADSPSRIMQCHYLKADELEKEGKYEEAATQFEAAKDYEDGAERALSCRYTYAIALLENGENAQAAINFGKLGDYKDAASRSRALWDAIAVRETIGTGNWHTVGLLPNGTLVTTGYNYKNSCTVNDWKNIIAVSAASWHTVGLKADGTVVSAGEDAGDVSKWTDIQAISTGYYHTAGLKIDGTVVATGGEEQDVRDWKDIIAVDAGYNYTVGLQADGSVVTTDSTKGTKHWEDIIAIDAGFLHTVGLKADGTVVAVGSNNKGQCDVSGWTGIVAICSGDYVTVGLKANGTVVGAGSGASLVSSWRNIVAIAAYGNHIIGLKADGTVVAVGENDHNVCNVAHMRNILIYKNN